MKNISLRRFRDDIATFTEPIEVSRRGSDGNLAVLGFWTPYLQNPTDASSLLPAAPTTEPAPSDAPGEDDDFVIRPIRTPEEAAAVAPANPLRAVPKPSQKRSRR